MFELFLSAAFYFHINLIIVIVIYFILLALNQAPLFSNLLALANIELQSNTKPIK